MKPCSIFLSIAILTILNIGAGNTGTSTGVDYPSAMPKQATQPGKSSAKGSPSTELPPATATAVPTVNPPVDLDASIKQQDLENHKLIARKTQLEIDGLERSEWLKPSTLFSIFTTLAVVAGAYVGFGWSRSSYERAQASFERAQGNAERYKFEADRAKDDRDKAKAETDILTKEKEQTQTATNELKAQLAKLESQQEEINTGIRKAAIKLVAVGDPYDLRRDTILADILDSFHVSIIFVTNISDEPAFFGIGSMKIPGEAGLRDWDAAMEARKQFLTTQPTTQTSDEPPTYYEHVQPHQTVRFVIPRKAAHNTLSGGFMKPEKHFPRGYSPAYYFTNESYGRIEIIEFTGRFRKMVDPGVSPEYDPLSH